MGMEPGAITLAEDTVEHSPASPGVYALYSGDELTYLGLAAQGDGIRARLEDHLRGGCAGCSRQATRFTYELTHHPRRRHSQRIGAHRERHGGRVPSCNECRPCGS